MGGVHFAARPELTFNNREKSMTMIATPSGMTKVEIRIMYIWESGLQPVTTVLRTGRGQMMGVDFNKNLDWVGASAGFVGPS